MQNQTESAGGTFNEEPPFDAPILEPLRQDHVNYVEREEIREEIIEVPEIRYIEKVVYIPKYEIIEHVLHVDKVVYEERVCHVNKPVVEEKIVPVPQIEWVDKYVEVPQYVYRENIIEVPDICVVEHVIPVLKKVPVEKHETLPSLDASMLGIQPQNFKPLQETLNYNNIPAMSELPPEPRYVDGWAEPVGNQPVCCFLAQGKSHMPSDFGNAEGIPVKLSVKYQRSRKGCWPHCVDICQPL